VFKMAASLFIEEEAGRYTWSRHPHNGYYAGDFSADFSTPVRVSPAQNAAEHRPW
jgi:hypothetical protein